MLRRVLISFMLLILGVSVVISAASPETTKKIPPEATVVPTFEPGYVLLSQDELLDLAFVQASRYGLERIDHYESAWLLQGDWLAEQGVVESIFDAGLPLFVVAFQGSGEWQGFGFTLKEHPEPEEIHGVTIALDGTTGRTIIATSGFESLVLTSGRRYRQVEFTEPSDNLIPLPPPPSSQSLR